MASPPGRVPEWHLFFEGRELSNLVQDMVVMALSPLLFLIHSRPQLHEKSDMFWKRARHYQLQIHVYSWTLQFRKWGVLVFIFNMIRTPNIFEGRIVCLYKKISILLFPLPNLFSGSGIITLKTFGKWQNHQIYKVRASSYQGRFVDLPFTHSRRQLLRQPFLCLRAIRQHQSVPFLGCRHPIAWSQGLAAHTEPCDSSPQGRLPLWLPGSYSGVIRPL